MATYLAIADGTIAAGKPVTTALLTRYRDNPIALYENAVVGTALVADVTESADAFTDVTAWNITAGASTVWAIHYACKVGHEWAVSNYTLTFKVYAASLAASPGTVLWRHHAQPNIVTLYLEVGSAAVAANCNVVIDYDGGLARTEALHVDALVYVGAAATTIKFAFKKDPSLTWAKVYTGSVMLAQEISGTI